MNWEYVISPSSAADLDSSTFRGISLYKKLVDDSGTTIAEVVATPQEFRDGASDELKASYINVAREILVKHLDLCLTPLPNGRLPEYISDHAYGPYIYQVRFNYNIISGATND